MVPQEAAPEPQEAAMAQTTIEHETKYNPFVREWMMILKQREGSA